MYISFGPVPSRRLGRSLGINNIPPKICTYTCVYCQLGRTQKISVKRRRFYGTAYIYEEISRRVREIENKGGSIDYLTFVPDGEPTLDLDLGEEIRQLKTLGLPVAVISNSSLIWDEGVRNDLACADLVSLKVDAVVEKIWRTVDRPHRSLDLKTILNGIASFSEEFKGVLITESMLIHGVNTERGHLDALAEFISEIMPAVAYLSVPVRPPAEEWVRPADAHELNAAYQIFRQKGINAELLVGVEEGEFHGTGEVGKDLLAITSVHPMSENDVDRFLAQSGADWSVVNTLLESGLMVVREFDGRKYYLRNLER